MQFDLGPYFVKSILQATWQAFGWLFSSWYMWAFILFMAVLRLGPGMYESWRLRRAGIPEIDRMTGLEFEKYLEILFRRLGYQVERTRYVGDQGGDLILVKDGERILVQAKRHNRAISNKAVQEAAAARPHYKCHRAMVVANREFTQPARELARSNQVELWGRRKLAETVLSVQAAQKEAPTVAAEQSLAPARSPVVTQTPAVDARRPSPTPPTCRRCGRAMVLRQGPHGQFWGCSGFPKCRNTAPLSTDDQL